MSAIKKNLVWLASYPKSGNTWFRLFLNCLFTNKMANLNDNLINSLYSSFSCENILDLELQDFAKVERNQLRIKAYQYLNDNQQNLQFIKIHDSFVPPYQKEVILPVEPTLLAIYFVRNPLAVIPSFANHSGKSIPWSLEKLLDENASLVSSKDKPSDQIEQHIGTWNYHVKSWTEQKLIPIHIIIYEEMLADPFNTLKKVILALNLNYSDKEIRLAIENCSFEKLQKLEKEKGFNERPSSSKSFFFKGKPDYWKEVLSEKQIQEIISVNKPMMEKFGYL